MRTGFVIGAVLILGILIGTFVTGPMVQRNEPPQETTSSAPATTADPFETARDAADAAMDANRCEDAIAAYERALSIRFDPDAATDRGVCLRQLGRREQALAAFEFVTLKEPKHWQARYNLTAMLLEAGRIEEARKSFALLERQQADPNAIRTLEEAFARATR